MPTNQTTSAAGDPARSITRALAALREASEHLEQAAAASERPNLNVASALSHVAASRAVLRSNGAAADHGGADQRAA